MVQKRRYLSYLLRLWQEGGSERARWRASLERPQGGDRLGFASLEDLYAYLDAQTRSSSSGTQRLDEGRCRSRAKSG